MNEICLVIKAANQKYEDIKVNCNVTWTVWDLKNHLSVHYPSNPKITDQRLIYSGRLLLDYQLIKEVIEFSDGDNQNTFTFHLVCPQKPAIIITNDNNGDKNTNTKTMPGSNNAIPTSTLPPNISLDPLTNTANSTGISPPWSNPMSNLNNFQMDPDSMLVQQSYQTLLNQYYQYMIYNFLSTPPMDFVSYATLANAYVQSLNGTIPSQTFANQQQQQQNTSGVNTNINHQNRATNNNGNNGNNINQNINNNMRLIGENDDIFNRDWTDMIYSFSKAVVLLSIFYFYSSISRLFLFMLIFFAIYLYKNLLIHHLNPDGPNLENMGLANNNNNNNNNNQMRNIPNEANVPNNPDNNNNNNNNNNSNTLAQDNSRYSGLRFVWVFITSLFTSLIPDPNPI